MDALLGHYNSRVRVLSLAVGYVKYRALSFLHTYANKTTGIALCFSPILHQFFELNLIIFVLCVIASLSAVEELIINYNTLKNLIGTLIVYALRVAAKNVKYLYYSEMNLKLQRLRCGFYSGSSTK